MANINPKILPINANTWATLFMLLDGQGVSEVGTQGTASALTWEIIGTNNVNATKTEKINLFIENAITIDLSIVYILRHLPFRGK
jgi:hypothetical protein